MCLVISTDKRLQWTKDPDLVILGKWQVWRTSTFLTAGVKWVASACQLLRTAGEIQMFIRSRLLHSYMLFQAGWSKSKSKRYYLLWGADSGKIRCLEKSFKASHKRKKMSTALGRTCQKLLLTAA